MGVAGDGHQDHALAFDDGQDGREFIAFATVGQGDHQVVTRDHAQVAMAGFSRVHKEGGCTGGGQGGSNLAANVAAFAHAHDDDATTHRQHGLHRVDESFSQALLHVEHRLGFNRQGLTRQVQQMGLLFGGELRHGFSIMRSVAGVICQCRSWKKCRPTNRLR